MGTKWAGLAFYTEPWQVKRRDICLAQNRAKFESRPRPTSLSGCTTSVSDGVHHGDYLRTLPQPDNYPKSGCEFPPSSSIWGWQKQLLNIWLSSSSSPVASVLGVTSKISRGSYDLLEKFRECHYMIICKNKRMDLHLCWWHKPNPFHDKNLTVNLCPTGVPLHDT